MAVARKPSLLDGRGVLLETFENPRGAPPYASIRTERYRYDLQFDGQEFLYDIKLDPWELESKHNDPRLRGDQADPQAQAAEARELQGHWLPSRRGRFADAMSGRSTQLH